MFGDRCYGLASCGHSVNWTCPCTCDEEYKSAPLPRLVLSAPVVVSEVDRLKAVIERMTLYVQHDTGCDANDLDYLDDTPCTCGLRLVHNPKGVATPSTGGAGQ